ncbi:Predicted transcription regulator containing HTH domain [Legionella beliardensis]|uniref:Predicted transcription regulator containing HTH domain n=1 Tax=Legionella beliardensis TaxID=91822 RepID=A0A378JQU4_9GAMM|nr:transcriptional regulator [Legionella beliardensis]STX55557.1 Predicted transcription regulator containing HTH domain [Legionella beliardensis]
MTALSIDYVDQKTKHKFHLPLAVFKKPVTDKEYAHLEKVLDKLIDEVRDDENHPLALAMQIIGDNLEQYDNEHFPLIGENITNVAMVNYLMTIYQLQQKDLAPIFGGQANVSKFLKGERNLGKNHIVGLKKKFKISADFFLK